MGRFVGTFVEERASIPDDIIAKHKELKLFKEQLKKAGVARGIVAQHLRESIKSNRESCRSFTATRYQATLNYKYNVKGAKIQTSEWFNAPITAAQLKELAANITPLRKERSLKRGPVIQDVEKAGIKYKLYNGLFTKDTVETIRKVSGKPERYYVNKRPNNLTHHVGVEMEMLLRGCTMNELGSRLTKYGLMGKVNITSDGSIHPERYDARSGAELRIIDSQSSIVDTITKLCDMLKQDNVKADVADTCGLHVHLDMRKRIVYDAYKNLTSCLPVLRLLTPKNRRSNSFCMDNRSTDLYKDLNAMGGERYWAINPQSLSKHQTLEVRMHHGSVDAYEITNWISLLTTIVDAKPIMRKISSVNDLIMTFKLSGELADYVRGAFAKHNPQTLVVESPEAVVQMRGA